MKKIRLFIFVTLVLAINFSWAQVSLPHYESFDYTAGDSLPMHGWIGVNGGDQILVSAGNLDYTGLPTSVGNKVSFAGSGRDFQKVFTTQTSGTVYMSFIFKVTDLLSLDINGGYFAGLANGTTYFGSTVWVRKNGSGFNMGFYLRSSPIANVQWDATALNTNDSVFVVVSYELVSGLANDIANIWINPASSSFGGATPPTPNITITNNSSSTAPDLEQIDRIFLRQDSDLETPAIDLDEIRVNTTWAGVTSTGIKEVTDINKFQVSPNPSNGNFSIFYSPKTSFDVKVFNALGSIVYTQTNLHASLPVNLSNFNKGIYFIQLKDNNSSAFATRKIVIQ